MGWSLSGRRPPGRRMRATGKRHLGVGENVTRPTLASTSDALRLRILRTGSVRVWAGRIAWTDATPMIEALRIGLR